MSSNLSFRRNLNRLDEVHCGFFGEHQRAMLAQMQARDEELRSQNAAFAARLERLEEASRATTIASR